MIISERVKWSIRLLAICVIVLLTHKTIWEYYGKILIHATIIVNILEQTFATSSMINIGIKCESILIELYDGFFFYSLQISRSTPHKFFGTQRYV